MKIIYLQRIVISLIIFLSGTFSNLRAQMVYIPDSAFRAALINSGYAGCIAGDSIDSSCPQVASATDLFVVFSNISDLQGIQAFGSLTSLACYDNQLTSLPALPGSLTYLDCSYNQLTSLSALPNSLVTIYCIHNQLTNLSNLPVSLTLLDCSYNQLTSLPALPASLTHLQCGGNQLTSLPALPDSLTDLRCSANLLVNLPPLDSLLTYLECTNNQLGSLPVLPGLLNYMNCDGNQIANLPALPASLTWLSCYSNPLTSLPALPDSLVGLVSYYDQLTSLPALPNTLRYLYCDHNQLTALPELPDSMIYLRCSYNPNLTCLPELKTIYDLEFWNTSVNCIPDYGNVSYSGPSGLPLCGSNNPGGCDFFWNINGKTYFDENGNCLFDSADVLQQNMRILLYKNGILDQQLYTGANGAYIINVNDSAGAYSVQLDTSFIPFDVLCPSSSGYNDTISATDSLFYDNDFALKCRTGFDLGAMSIEGFGFTPGHNATAYIEAGDIANFYGAHCASGISGSVTVSFTGPVSYVSPDWNSLAPDSVSGNTLIYNIADFGTTNLANTFNFIILTDSAAVIGSQVCFTVSVTSTSIDNNPSNDVLTHCFNVQSSYDPNDKEVYPLSDIDATGDKWLTYTVHFQNTGTSPAEHIYIADTLDANLDPSSFRLLAYSFQPLVQVLNGGIVRFNFPNINLPDSATNEPASHGFVQYKIKLKDGLPPCTQINNTAYIYFDFNPPVATNTTVNTLILPLGISPNGNSDMQFSVYPNPSHNEYTVHAGQFTAGEKIILKIFNALGEELFFTAMHAAEYEIPAAPFPTGIYFLRIETDQGVLVKKLVKE